jgi:hypothetical protein
MKEWCMNVKYEEQLINDHLDAYIFLMDAYHVTGEDDFKIAAEEIKTKLLVYIKQRNRYDQKPFWEKL